MTTPFTEWLWGWAAIASVTTAPSPFEASMCPAKVQVDFIWADRRGEKLGKRRICSCVLSSCCHLLLLKLKEFVGCTLLAVQGEQEMNECLPGFTARLEPLCYTACLANLEGTRIGIVKRIMYAVFPPPCLTEKLFVVLICLLLQSISMFTQSTNSFLLKMKSI